MRYPVEREAEGSTPCIASVRFSATLVKFMISGPIMVSAEE